VVVLADASKVGREHMVRFAELTDVDVLVTDASISDRDAKALRRNDIEVVIA
jgi:DeoR family fructose operon transcriptional repressor